MVFGLFKKRRNVEELGDPIGEITHYFPHVKAAVIKIKNGTLATGDSIYIKGHTTAFEEKIKSMQVNHKSIENASKGQEIGLKVVGKVRHGDKVYKVQ